MLFRNNPINSIGLPVISANYTNSSRFKRVSDQEFNDSVEKMQKISRLTNAVFLVQGIVKGDISPGELISEFLNFGAYKPSDVDQIDTEKLKGITEKLQGLSKKLTLNNKVEEMMNRLSSINSIVMKSNKVTTLKNPGNDYLTEVKNLKGIEFVNVDVYAKKVDKVIAEFDKIRKTESMKTADIINVFDNLTNLFATMKNSRLQDIKKNIQGKAEKLMKHEIAFESISRILESMSLFIQKQNDLKYNSKTESTTLNVLKTNVEKLGEVVKAVKEYSINFDVLKQVIVSRHHRKGNTDLKFTSGFSNGLADLDLIANDLQDNWIKEILHNNANDVTVALQLLEVIKRHFKGIDDAFGKTPEEVFEAVSKIVSEVSELSKMSASFKTVASKLTNIQEETSRDDLVPQDYEKYKSFHEHVIALFHEVKAIKAVVSLSENLKSSENSKKVKNILSKIKYQDNKELPEKLKKLREDSDFADIFKILMSAQEDVSLLANNANELIKTPGNAIETDFKYLQPFIDQSGKFLKMLLNLGVMKEFSAIGSITSVLRKFDKSTTKHLSDFSSIAGVIENVKPKLKESEKEMNGKKGSKGREIDALVGGKYISDDSKIIGSATRVLLAMKQMANEDIKVEWDYAKLIIQKQLKTMTTEDMRNLEIVIGMGDELKHLISEIKQGINSATLIPSSNFEEHAMIFEPFKNIDGIDDDFGKLIESVETLLNKLSSSDSDIVKPIIPIFEKLDQIGLNFAKHRSSLDKSKDALNSMDLFFANLGKSLAASPDTRTPSNPGKVPGSSGHGGSRHRTRMNRHHRGSGADWRCIIGIPLVGSIFFGIYILWKYREEIFRRGPPKEPVKPPVIPNPNQQKHPVQPPQPVDSVEEVPEPDIEVPPPSPPPSSVKLPVPVPGEQLPPPIPCNTEILVQQLEYVYEKHHGNSYNFVRFFDLTHEHLHPIPPKPALLHVHRDEWRHDIGYTYTTEFNFLTKGYERAFIHANVMTVGKTKKVILTQAPMTFDRARKIATIEKFFMMAIEEQAKQIFQLCDWSETSTIMADVYIPENNEPVSYGRIRVTRRREFIPEAADGHVVVTIIHVADPKTRRETIIEHHRYTNWQSGMCPEETAPMAYMIKKAFENPRSCAIVHCHGGFSRTGCFAFIMLGVELMRNNRQFTVTQLFKEVRKVRPGCIETGDQIGFSMFVIFAVCSENRTRGGEQDDRYRELMADFRTRYLSWLTYGEAPRGYPVYVLPPE